MLIPPVVITTEFSLKIFWPFKELKYNINIKFLECLEDFQTDSSQKNAIWSPLSKFYSTKNKRSLFS